MAQLVETELILCSPAIDMNTPMREASFSMLIGRYGKVLGSEQR
jgi:hypothetical protein